MTDAVTLYNAGTQALKAGQFHPALELLQQAVESSTAPKIQGSAWRNMGIALRKLGSTKQAARAFVHALEIDGKDVDARYSLANALVELGQYDDAIREFQFIRKARPQWAQPINNEGAAWMAKGCSEEAAECFEAAIQVDPYFAHAWGNLGAARAAQGRHAAPLHTLQHALRMFPNNPQIHARVGHLLTELGHFDSAIRTFENILQNDPSHGSARAGLGLALHRSGDSEAGLHTLAPSIIDGHPQPDEAVAFARICLHLKQPTHAISALEHVLERSKQPATKTFVGKHLGQVLDAAGQYDAAFAAITTANSHRAVSFNATQHSRRIDSIIAQSTQSTTQSACVDSTPVFIVGMPRSGTTLLEQMLDAHPSIHGAGERGDLQMVAREMESCTLDVPTLNHLATAYLNRIKPLAPHAKKITDKMPDNFLYLREASQLFPEARVIHCVRDPADTGLSCLFQHFKDTLPWATRQQDIAAFTRDYHRLMDHWAEYGTLRMMTVPYESLVSHPEKWARQILRFLNLPFHSAVLHPEQNRRTVRTASHDQVRQPIHTNRIGRFKAYKDHIQTLIELRSGLPQFAGRTDRKDHGRKDHV